MLAGLTPSTCSALAHDVGVAVREVQAIRLSDAEMGIGWPWLAVAQDTTAIPTTSDTNTVSRTADKMPPVSEAKVSSKHIDAIPTVEAAGTLTGSTAMDGRSVRQQHPDRGPETTKDSADLALDTSKDSTGTATVTALGPTISTKERTVREFDKAIANNLHEANALRARLRELDAKNARLSNMKDAYLTCLADTEAASRELEQLDKDDAQLQLEMQRLERRKRDNADKKSSAKQRRQSGEQQLSEMVRLAKNEGLFALLGTKGK
ncbi:hypothetical protein CEP51_014930 [Fusarium floridanum]|uniref:Uncharacterized protein n=2 Tax=Fusarium solani species complex TaxID=232080 RepID=A0A428PJG9_9HYPO|nr:hypothetical protein CEP51_014930 [Fusarium floridanum]